MSSLQYAVLPDEMKADMKQLQDKLNKEIEKVNSAYQKQYETSMVNDRPVKMDNMFKALAKHCKEIIKVYKELNRNNFDRQKLLFRGIKSSDDALYGKPFDARKPKDSNRELHDLVNGTISNLGFEANRENAMFVSGDRSQASNYGSLYIMFPVDGFKFTWSKTVKDLVLDSSKKLEMMDKDVVRQLRAMAKEARETASEPSAFPISDPDDLFYSGYEYDRDYNRISRAIEMGMMPDEAQDLLDNILTDDSIQKHFEFTDQDLYGAILSEKEVYIKGDYYAVRLEHSKELFKFLEDMDTDNVELPENFGEVPNILDKGDIVRILEGTHKDKLGTITYVYSDKYEVFVSQKIGDITIAKEQVELYRLPDGSIPVYEKNDKIIVSDPQSKAYGTVANLDSVSPSGKIEIYDSSGKYHSLYKNQIEPYTPEREQEIQKDLETRPPVINENDDVVVSDPDSEYYGERGRVNFIYNSGKIEVRLAKNDDYIEFQPNQLVLLKNAPPELLKKTPGQFNLGDTVKITDGEYKGYSGTVIYLYSNYSQAEVELNGVNKRVDVNLTALEHVDPNNQQNADDSSNEIKVGDMIQVSNDESSYYGVVGEVIDVGQTSDGKPTVKFKTTIYPSGIKTFASWVEKVDQPQQSFSVGDKVNVNWNPSAYNGENGTIESGPDSDGDYKILINGGGLTYVPVQGLKKIEEPKTAVTFSEGDTVKITGPSAYNNSSFIGYTGTITSVSDDGKFAGVRVEGAGMPDTILTYETTNLSNAEGDEIDNLTWEPEPEAKAPFKVGDTVKNIKDDHPYYGQTAEVKTIYSSGNVGLVYSIDGEQAIDPAKWLEKVQAPAKATAPKFEVNDRVEVVSQFPSLIGMKGKITQVSPNFDFVSVWLDGNTASSSFPTSAIKKVDANDPTEFHLGDMVEVINDELASYGQKGKVTDMDVNMLVVQDSTTGDVFFAKKANVKKIG
jgi:transcription antitermination factor NusG